MIEIMSIETTYGHTTNFFLHIPQRQIERSNKLITLKTYIHAGNKIDKKNRGKHRTLGPIRSTDKIIYLRVLQNEKKSVNYLYGVHG